MPDGPRAVAAEEFESLMAMVNPVFRRNSPGGPTMLDEYPHLFAQDNLSNLRVIAEDGRIVSHVGTTIRDAVILGCHVRVANVGAVATHPDFRGRGNAGACFDDACRNAREQGVDFMLISGDRKLYRLAGCRRVGCHTRYTLSASEADGLRGDVSVSRYQGTDFDAVKRIFESEPVRHLRPMEEWQRFIRDGRSSHHYANLWVIRRRGTMVAYAAVLGKHADGRARLEEFAGDRAALMSAAREIMDAEELSALSYDVTPEDFALHSYLKERARADDIDSGGTRLIVDFERLMARLCPLFEERVGAAAARRLSFREQDGTLRFEYDGELLAATSRGGAAQLIWGTLEAPEWKWASAGPGKKVLESIFPIPSLVYGFSYV